MTPRLPAEWETQTALLLTWPHAHGLWGNMLPETEKTFASIAAIASHHQAVMIAYFDEAHRQHIQNVLKMSNAVDSSISYYLAPSNDSWGRDHGPISIKYDQQTRLGKFIFNAWGKKYKYDLDNQVVNTLAAQHAFKNYPLAQYDWVLEGGSLETDGQHTLLTTESCLLNPNRNPELTRAQIEERLKLELGIQRVLWLKNSSLTGDDTDGHIDMLARFCDPHTICYITVYPDSSDAASLTAMADELRLLRTTAGEPYHLVPLPPIQTKYSQSGEQMPASYANFLILNGAVIVPIYDDINDDAALACIQQCFPQRKIYGVNSLALIHMHGSIHCSTMNIF